MVLECSSVGTVKVVHHVLTSCFTDSPCLTLLQIWWQCYSESGALIENSQCLISRCLLFSFLCSPSYFHWLWAFRCIQAEKADRDFKEIPSERQLLHSSLFCRMLAHRGSFHRRIGLEQYRTSFRLFLSEPASFHPDPEVVRSLRVELYSLQLAWLACCTKTPRHLSCRSLDCVAESSFHPDLCYKAKRADFTTDFADVLELEQSHTAVRSSF